MSRLLAIAHKELLHLVRDRRSLVAALGLPVLLLVLYGYAVDFDLHELSFYVVDQDHSSSSRRLTEELAAAPTFRYVGQLTTADEAEQVFERRRAVAVVVIPPQFERQFKSRHVVPVQVLLDGADGSTAAIAQGYATGALNKVSQTLLAREALAMGLPPDLTRPRMELRTRVLYNPNLQSRQFLVPGLIALILTMLSAVLTSGVIVRERERGSFELLAASPVSSLELVVGKLLPYLMLAFADVGLAVVLGWGVFGVVPQGSLWLLFGLSLIFVLAALAIGLLFSCLAATQQTAMQLAFVATVVPTMTLSGFAFPVRNMPFVLQVLAQVLPATHFMVISRAIILKGVGLEAFWPRVAALAVLAVLLIRLAVRRFRKTL